MKEVKKNYLMLAVVSILILGIGVSLAYWTARIFGEGNPMSFTTGEVNIVFKDGPEIANGIINPGWSYTKTFTVENETTSSSRYNIIIEDLVNTFVTEGYLQYKITSTNGYNMTEYKDIPKSKIATNTALAYNIEIPAQTTQEYTIEFIYRADNNFDQSEDMDKVFSGKMMIEEGSLNPNSLFVVLTDGKKYPTVNTRTNFDTVLGTETPTTGTIYKEDTYIETEGNNIYPVYYFAGNVADNWVKFAGYYWRIIRTNEDGGIRLLYHGASTTATDSYITASYMYNPTYNNTMYVGYMYGSTGSIGNNRNNTTSPQIKTKLESWYSSDIASYDNAVSKTAIYCNDRASGQYASSGIMYYAAYDRLYHGNSGRRPSYQCGQATGGYHNTSGTWTTLSGAYSGSAANVADRFSVSTASGGNGQLSQPIGLMTADEVAFAGGLYGTNAPNTYYYLNSSGGSSTGSYWWWTMSPRYFSGSNAYVFVVDGFAPGQLTDMYVNVTSSAGAAVRPVLSLKQEVIVTEGDGTAENPYQVSMP